MKTGTIRAGTSAFTAEGWAGTFYPEGMQPRDYLSYYATQFDCVELDNTFYRTPAISTVKGWKERTPAGFLFAAKAPQAITHEKVLVDCEADLSLFLKTMDTLGEKLGPVLFQFGYFNKAKFNSQAEFLSVLKPFLKNLPKGYRFAVEIRNKYWVDARLLDLLREQGVAFALIDQSWVPRPWEYKAKLDLVTADFSYVRLLGDRKGIEARTKIWNITVVDRTEDVRSWRDVLRRMVIERKVRHLFLFANNHYAGYAPETVKLFWEIWGQGE